VFCEQNGRPAPGYDDRLADALSEIDISQKVPTMWAQFEALSHVPILVLRGEHSDLLSAATVAEMERRHSQLASVTVHAQGHAPLLKDRFTIGMISDFLRETDPDSLSGQVAANLAKRLPRIEVPEEVEA
jgi:pimeloyl-ACP methyl ester carboxylesterase